MSTNRTRSIMDFVSLNAPKVSARELKEFKEVCTDAEWAQFGADAERLFAAKCSRIPNPNLPVIVK